MSDLTATPTLMAKNWTITVGRAEALQKDFTVEAENREEAIAKAMDEASDIVWKRGDAEYSVEGVQEHTDGTAD
jgi:hypothetical protein